FHRAARGRERSRPRGRVRELISGKGHPRIAPVEQPDEEQSELLAKTLMGPDGQPLNVFKTLARVPQLGRRVNALGGYFMRHGDFPLRERELVILRTAALCRSDYEIGQHRWIGREMAGLSDAEIEAALDPELAFEWSEDDELVLAATD